MKSVKLTAVTAAVIATAMLPGAWAAEHAMNADVVVIGAGGAGMAASVKAAENGAKVVLLEKNAFIGGGAAFAEGLYGIETEWQRSKNYGLSSAESSKYVQRFHHFKADGKLNRLFMDESAKT